MPLDRVMLPQTSIACLRRSLGTCMYRATTRSVRIAKGMLMKKSQRQLKFWVM
jgi:hypothetical protein